MRRAAAISLVAVTGLSWGCGGGPASTADAGAAGVIEERLDGGYTATWRPVESLVGGHLSTANVAVWSGKAPVEARAARQPRPPAPAPVVAPEPERPVVREEPPPPPPVREEVAAPPTPDVVVPPERIHYVEPEYPERALRMRVEGVVLLAVTVAPDGSVSGAEVLRDPGQGLGQAAVRAARQWRYRPATRNGQAEEMTITVQVRFAR